MQKKEGERGDPLGSLGSSCWANLEKVLLGQPIDNVANRAFPGLECGLGGHRVIKTDHRTSGQGR